MDSIHYIYIKIFFYKLNNSQIIISKFKCFNMFYLNVWFLFSVYQWNTKNHFRY